MASLLTNLVPMFTNVCPCPTNDNASNISEWNHHYTQSIGKLCLCLAPNILAKVLPKTAAASIWNTLKNKYGKHSISTTYTEFKVMLDTPIPLHEYPETSLPT
ncbi:hypothetical protein BS17DRAFT_822675 [Gyrodon lividus]|nr:hypothetical protein BS17DRAFT_822675 [Gyrodon lividus]